MLTGEKEIKAIMRGRIEASQPKALEMWQEKGGLKEGYAGLLNLMDMLGAVWADALKEAAHDIAERVAKDAAELKAENERLRKELGDAKAEASGTDAALDVFKELMGVEEDET